MPSIPASSIQPFGRNKHGPNGGGTGVTVKHKVAWAEAYLHTKYTSFIHPAVLPRLLRQNGWMDEAGILGMEVDLGPDDIMLDGDPAPPLQKGGGALPKTGAEPPKFSAHV